MRNIRSFCALSVLIAAAGCSSGESEGGGKFYGMNNNPGTGADGTDANAADGADSNANDGANGNDSSTDGADSNADDGADSNADGADSNTDDGADSNADGADSDGTDSSTDGADGMSLDAGVDAGGGEPQCSAAVPGVDGALPKFSKQELSKLTGSAYLKQVDLNNDGYSEYFLTSLAEGIDLSQILSGVPLDFGGAYVLQRKGGPAKGTIGQWETIKGFDKAEKVGFPNESEWFDIDGDDIKDWIVAAGFLTKPTGKILWMKGAANGTFGKPQYVTVPDTKCWYHITLPLDMDADGDNDFVTSCHIGDTSNVNGPSRMEWFENDGKGKFTHHAIGDGGGSLFELHDLDADGDLDIVAPQFFGPKALVWYEQTGEKGTAWTQHLINESTGRGFITRFADMNGDGKVDMLYGNHNNEEAAEAINKKMGIYWFEIPAADTIRTLTNWDDYIHTVYEGFQVAGGNNGNSAGAPGMINVGDIDGDCDMDVTASGDGDEGLYVFVQQADGFEKVELSKESGNQNSGAQIMVDLDRDGDMDILWAVFGPQGLSLSSHVYAFLQI